MWRMCVCVYAVCRYDDVYVAIDGDGVQEQIFAYTITRHDLPLLMLSLTVVWGFMWFHMSSSFMATMAIMGIFLAFLPWLFVYVVLCGIEEMSVLTVLSFFLIIAIGTDDCFVYWDLWKYSAMLDLRPVNDPDAMNMLRGNYILGNILLRAPGLLGL